MALYHAKLNGKYLDNYALDSKTGVCFRWDMYKGWIPVAIDYQIQRKTGKSTRYCIRVHLTINNRQKGIQLHRLVCETFWEKPIVRPENVPYKKWKDLSAWWKKYISDKMLEVDHVNGNPHDYRPCNLEWVTPEENKRRVHAI